MASVGIDFTLFTQNIMRVTLVVKNKSIILTTNYSLKRSLLCDNEITLAPQVCSGIWKSAKLL